MSTTPDQRSDTRSADQVLADLRAGNRRFVEGRGTAFRSDCRGASAELSIQRPAAAILGCSDSRVVPELLFDQAAGELFVIRVAGNSAGPEEVASIRFAVESLGAMLIVVLGHTQCGAVTAAVDHARGDTAVDAGLAPIVDPIIPVASDMVRAGPNATVDTLVENVVRGHVQATVENLAAVSIGSGQPTPVRGAVYSLVTREVEFLPPVM